MEENYFKNQIYILIKVVFPPFPPQMKERQQADPVTCEKEAMTGSFYPLPKGKK